MNFHNNQNSYSTASSGFMSKVYAFMCLGLGVTAAIAYYLSPSMNPQIMYSVLNGGMLPILLLFFAQMGIILYLSSNIMNISGTAATALYIVFTGLMGITVAPLQYVYTDASIMHVFGIAALMFLAMAVYGLTTKSNLSSMNNILFMGLIGLMIAGLVNIFLHSSTLDLMMSACGVGIFSLLIAYDIQKLKILDRQALMSPQDSYKISILGALQLYLNIINLIQYLLRLFGQRRNNN